MDFKCLYSYDSKTIMKIAEDSKNRSNDRIQEIIAYAKEAGFQKIGIAYCTSVRKEADVLEQILVNEEFLVEKVNCKYGKMPFDDILEGYKGVSCNPAGQAFYLGEKKTELNIILGLCLGHDMIFNSKSKAPVTTLLVKDRKLNHRTVGRLQENK